MKLATVRIDGRTRAVRADDDVLVDVGAPDVGELLGHEDWAARATSATAASATTYRLVGAEYAPVVPQPSKVICVGLNYRDHAAESGAAVPSEPILFMKDPSCVVGPADDILIPRGSLKTDWEVELGVVIGSTARYLSLIHI